MTPTAKFRWLKRWTQVNDQYLQIPVLQQWWERRTGVTTWEGEWRDIPIEEQA